jgi:hypothetical protein
LTRDPAIKVYEAQAGIWNRNGTNQCDVADGGGTPLFHLALDNCVARDDRIPPLGFSGGGDLEIRPVNYVYPETAPGSGVLVNYDITSYAIPVPAGAVSPITVTATLRSQTTSKEFVESLRDQAVANSSPNDCITRTTGLPGKSRGRLLYDMWSRNGKAAPVAMASASGNASIPATPGEASRSAPMRVTSFDRATGNVSVSYAPACGAVDHTAYIGRFADLPALTYTAQACGLGAGGSATFHLGATSYFWLIVGNDGVREGSYGTKGSGVERPEDTSLTTCSFPQDLSRRCDP